MKIEKLPETSAAVGLFALFAWSALALVVGSWIYAIYLAYRTGSSVLAVVCAIPLIVVLLPDVMDRIVIAFRRLRINRHN